MRQNHHERRPLPSGMVFLLIGLMMAHLAEPRAEGLCSPIRHDPAPGVAEREEQPWELRLITRVASSLETCTAGTGGIVTPWVSLGFGGDWIRTPLTGSYGLQANGRFARRGLWAGAEVDRRSWMEEIPAPERRGWQETSWTLAGGLERPDWRIGFWRGGFWRIKGTSSVWGGSLHFPGAGSGSRPQWAMGGTAWRNQTIWGWSLDATLPIGARVSLGWSLEFPPARLGLQVTYASPAWGADVATRTDPRGPMAEGAVHRPSLHLATLGP